MKKKIDEARVAGGLSGVPSLGSIYGLAECPHLAEGEDEKAVDDLVRVVRTLPNDKQLKAALMKFAGDVRGGQKAEAAGPGGKFVSSPWRDKEIDPKLSQVIDMYAEELKRMGFKGSTDALRPFLMSFAEEIQSAGV